MGSPPKTTLFGWNWTSWKVRFVELSSCTSSRGGFADVCHPRGRWGFREVLVHVSLALLMALMGRTMMTNKHTNCKKSRRQIMFCWYLMFIRCDPLAFVSLPEFQKTILFFKKRYGIDIGWILWPVQFASMESMSNSMGVEHYGWMFPMPYWLSNPLLLKKRLFLKMLAYTIPRQRGDTFVGIMFEMHLK